MRAVHGDFSAQTARTPPRAAPEPSQRLPLCRRSRQLTRLRRIHGVARPRSPHAGMRRSRVGGASQRIETAEKILMELLLGLGPQLRALLVDRTRQQLQLTRRSASPALACPRRIPFAARAQDLLADVVLRRRSDRGDWGPSEEGRRSIGLPQLSHRKGSSSHVRATFEQSGAPGSPDASARTRSPPARPRRSRAVTPVWSCGWSARRGLAQENQSCEARRFKEGQELSFLSLRRAARSAESQGRGSGEPAQLVPSERRGRGPGRHPIRLR